MSPYKSFISAAKTYMKSVTFLRFLLSAHIYVFSLGGLIFLLGSFMPGVYDLFTCVGGIIVFAGLLLTLIKEDMLTMVLASGSLAFVSLVAWIIGLVVNPWAGVINDLYNLAGMGSFYGFGSFRWQPFIYFLIFGAIAAIVFLKSERFKQMRTEAVARHEKMRAEAAARAAVACPRCGTGMPRTAGFCPHCGAPNPAMPYTPPAGQYAPPPYAPPGQPPYPPGAYGQPPYAPPAAPYAPPYAPYAPAASEASVPPAAPEEQAEPVPPPVAPAAKNCVNCGAELPAEAVFCGKCGTKQ